MLWWNSNIAPPFYTNTRARHGLAVLPDGWLDERNPGEDGLQQGGVGGVIIIVIN